MTSPLAIDTSVAVPLLVRTHNAHRDVVRWWDRREVALAGHALAETYAVLTRLPGDMRLDPRDAAALLADRFAPPFLMGEKTARELPQLLSQLGIAGGAVYDALVALAAADNGARLATRDARAQGTYEKVGVLVARAG